MKWRLLALAGTIILPVIWLKRRRKLEQDRISELSDDIIVQILSKLSIKEAVKTSILSRRWRNLCRFLPVVEFRCNYSMSLDKTPDDEFNRLDCFKFLRAVDHFFRLYSGRKIFHLSMWCCFLHKFPANYLERWMRYAVKFGVEELELIFETAFYGNQDLGLDAGHELCTFSWDLLTEASSLKYLLLVACSLKMNVKCQVNGLNSLTTLCLDVVPLDNGEVLDILASCRNLQVLKFRICKLPDKLCINTPSLRILSIRLCTGFKELELCTLNLSTFECIGKSQIKISLSNAPNLENMSVDFIGRGTVLDIISNVAKCSRNLKSLRLKTDDDEIPHIPSDKYILNNLIQLNLSLNVKCKCDLLNLSRILEVCPFLLKFHFTAIGPTYNDKEAKRVPACHNQLKEMKFGGFSGTGNEIEFLLFVLKCATTLEKMIISRYHNHRCHCLSDRWELRSQASIGQAECQRIIAEHLQWQASSRNVKLILQD